MSVVKTSSYEREYFGYLFTKYDNINKLSKREKKFFKNKFSDLICTLNISSLSDKKISKQFRIPEYYVHKLRTDTKYYNNFIKKVNYIGKNNPMEIKWINKTLRDNIDIIIEKKQDGYSFLDITCMLKIPYDTKALVNITNYINTMEDGVDLQDNKDINYVLGKLKKGKSLSHICLSTKLFRDNIDIVDCLERNNINTKEFLTDKDYKEYILPVIEYAKLKSDNNKIRVN